MDFALWTSLVHPDYNQPEGAPSLWELFHENSKTTRYSKFMEADDVVDRVRRMHPAIRYPTLPAIELPAGPSRLSEPLRQAIESRRSERAMEVADIDLGDVSAMLRCGYGITLSNEGTNMPRSFRATPSGGALYPLELYVYLRNTRELPTGLYHYEPEADLLRRIGTEFGDADLARAFVQGEVIMNASMIVFCTAVFERSIFKYGERGYRFALIEAGHIAQNIILAATDLGYGSVCLGGYFDHEVDELLRIDGVTHSTVYGLAVGGRSQ